MDISAFISLDSVVFKLIIALFLGLFIGLRREMDIQKEGSESFVGIRTLPLIVVLGAFWVFLHFSLSHIGTGSLNYISLVSLQNFQH